RYSGSSDVSVIGEEIRKALDERESANLNIRGTTDNPILFSESLERAKASNKYGGLVDSHTPDDLISKKIMSFLSEDGMAGGAVEPNGNITAVFKNSVKEGKHVTDELILTAILNGGDRLDCYAGDITNKKLIPKYRNGYLPGLYENYGFEAVARVPFNADEVDADFVDKYDVPRDVLVFMHNGDSAQKVAENIGTYPRMTLDEYMKLPAFDDYGEALAYRDKLIEDRKKAKGTKGGTTDNLVLFSESLERAKASNKYGGLVDPHTPDDLISKKIRSFLSEDGMAGAAVEPRLPYANRRFPAPDMASQIGSQGRSADVLLRSNGVDSMVTTEYNENNGGMDNDEFRGNYPDAGGNRLYRGE
ncbi:MAG: hypothetical protein RSA97_09500, partial [Oscillospiraceae bacterium]